MKKSIIKLIVFVALFVLFFAFSALVLTFYWNKEEKIKNSQDYVIMGTPCSCIFQCKFIYGIKDGVISELDIRKEEDKSNIYEVVLKNENDKYSNNKYKDYKYNANTYKEKDVKVFDNIVALANEKYHYPLIYQFIVTDKGYYIHASLREGDKDEYGFYKEKQGIYKYDEENNSLSFLIELDTCDEVDYFHEK